MLIPKVVNSIVCGDIVKIDQKTEAVCYKINSDNGVKTNVFAYLPKYNKKSTLSEIVMENDEFVNGFKVVKLANDSYSYIRESDNKLMPYQYDVAFNFNEYGFAMVGKDGSVSWINKDFKYLNYKGIMVEEENNNWNNFDGWQGINNFSNGDNPLSRVFCGKEEYGRTAYFTPNGDIKKFYQYNGNISNNLYRDVFFSGTDFNNSPYALADNYILDVNGFCILKEDIIKLSLKEGFIDFLFDDAKFNFEKLNNTQNILKKKI